MIVIYDFDGTLTPYPLARYPIMQKYGYDDEKIMGIVNNAMNEDKSVGLYDAYYQLYRDFFPKNNLEMTEENICYGAKDVKLNEGVIEYFKKFNSSKTGIKHYIVTAGVQLYVENTPVSKLVDGIYGVTFKKNGNVYNEIDRFLTDKKKIDVIKKICEDNNEKENVICFGDGLTDKYAFEYIHSIGGKNIFVVSSEKNMKEFKLADKDNLIDAYVKPDYSDNSEISKYIEGYL